MPITVSPQGAFATELGEEKGRKGGAGRRVTRPVLQPALRPCLTGYVRFIGKIYLSSIHQRFELVVDVEQRPKSVGF